MTLTHLALPQPPGSHCYTWLFGCWCWALAFGFPSGPGRGRLPPNNSFKRNATSGVRLIQALGRMRTITVNLALILAPLGWLLAAFGTMSLVGDYHPDTAREVIIANQNRSYAALSVGIVFLVTALWLSGYTFHSAKKRALIVVLAVVLPLLVALAALFR